MHVYLRQVVAVHLYFRWQPIGAVPNFDLLDTFVTNLVQHSVVLQIPHLIQPTQQAHEDEGHEPRSCVAPR